MGAEADCLEAIYNLGVVNKRLGETGAALGLFEKLHAILPNSVEVHSRKQLARACCVFLPNALCMPCACTCRWSGKSRTYTTRPTNRALQSSGSSLASRLIEMTSSQLIW